MTALIHVVKQLYKTCSVDEIAIPSVKARKAELNLALPTTEIENTNTDDYTIQKKMVSSFTRLQSGLNFVRSFALTVDIVKH